MCRTGSTRNGAKANANLPKLQILMYAGGFIFLFLIGVCLFIGNPSEDIFLREIPWDIEYKGAQWRLNRIDVKNYVLFSVCDAYYVHSEKQVSGSVKYGGALWTGIKISSVNIDEAELFILK